MFIRNLYEKYGVDCYYENYSKEYRNFHINEVKYLLEKNIYRIIDDKNNKILDLCSGNGEVTDILLNMNIKNIVGCDPYMNKIYENNNTQKPTKTSIVDSINAAYFGTKKIYKYFYCYIKKFVAT